MSTNNSQKRAKSKNDSWVVAADCNVLRPAGGGQAENKDEHGNDEKHPCDYYGFPLPPFEGTHACLRESEPAGLQALSGRHAD